MGDGADMALGSVVTMTGGNIGRAFTIDSGVQATLSGGRMGRSFTAEAGSTVELLGGEFKYNGVAVNHGQFTLSDGDVFAGTLADGSAFLFSGLAGDQFHGVSFRTIDLEPVPTQLFDINDPGDTVPHGLRPGQTLLLSGTGELSSNFTANDASLVINGGSVGDDLETSSTLVMMNGGSIGNNALFTAGSQIEMNSGSVGFGLTVQDSTFTVTGGNINRRFRAIDSRVNIDGGEIESDFTASQGTVVTITAGSIDWGFTAEAGSRIDIRGGNFDGLSPFGESGFHALANSEINLFGKSFLLDGEILAGLPLGEAVAIDQRDVRLTGQLIAGDDFSFNLSSDPFSFINDLFDANATITLTRLSDIGDYNDDGTVNAADYTV